MSGKLTAIVTGASGGIGGGLVEGFLEEGYNVVATSRNANQRLTASRGLVILEGDIGKQQTAIDAVETAINNFGTVDVSVNNAGTFLTSRSCERRNPPRRWCGTGASVVSKQRTQTRLWYR